MYTMSFEIAAFVLSIFCFSYCLVAKRSQYIFPKGIKAKLMDQHFTYLAMLLSNMLSAIASVVGVYLLDIEIEGLYFWQYLFHALYFIFHTTLSVCFCLYIMNVTGVTLHRKKIFYILFSLPYILSELIVFTNNFTKWAFDIDPVYHRGPLMIFLYAAGAFYVMAGFVVFLKHKKAISSGDSIAVGAFLVIASIGIVTQAVYSKLLIELFSEALACLVLMIVLEEKSGRLDFTTGVYNRKAFEDENRKLFDQKKAWNLIVVKLKSLERIVNKFGGRESDVLLLDIASKLKDETSIRDVYAYRRENFAIILKEGNPKKIIDDILEIFNNDFLVGKNRIRVDVDVFLIKIPEDVSSTTELDDLLSSSYDNSKKGSYFVPFEDISHLKLSSKYETALKRALENKTLLVYFQPIWSVKERCTVSAEALLRTSDDELKDLSPQVYIPVAEKTGLIREIGLFVFEEVCKFIKDERFINSKVEYVELNLSSYQFLYDDLIDSFEEIRNKYGVKANQINLEITETVVDSERYAIAKTLDRFRELGYTLSIDDFGTGYSNFYRLINSKCENIKIDKSILWDALKNDNASLVLKTINTFIKELDSYIVQEGVETKEQLDLAEFCGCDYIQGFYISKAISKEDFFEFIDNENKK